MGRFVNPFTDVGFKIIFGQEVSKPMLLHFLNTLLAGERVITDISFLDKEQPAEYKEDRSLIYDLLCETETKERIIVEMQNKAQPNFIDRCLYYCSQALSRQGERGDEWGYRIHAVYLVAFVNFRMDALGDHLRTDVGLTDLQTGKLFTDKERFVFLQLPVFNKEAETCDNDFERWIYVLKNMAVLERMPWAAQDSVFRRLAKIAEVRNLTKEERFQYDRSLKHYRDSLNVMRGAIQEGLEKGRTEGRAKGIAEGRAEERMQVAKRMKAMGLAASQIAQVTGLETGEIERL